MTAVTHLATRVGDLLMTPFGDHAGWALAFADEDVERAAAETLLGGTVERLTLEQALGFAAGHPRVAAAAEVVRPIFFGVAVIIIVFLPIASLRGMEGKMFAPLAYTISIALGCALVLSMTHPMFAGETTPPEEIAATLLHGVVVDP